MKITYRIVARVLVALLVLPLLAHQNLFAEDTPPEFVWSEGFLEKEYPFSQQSIKKALDTIFAKCVAVETTSIQNKKGTIVIWGVGDRNGKWQSWSGVGTIKELDINDGGVIVAVKTVNTENIIINTIIVGFKVGDGDKKASENLHTLLSDKLRKENLTHSLPGKDQKKVRLSEGLEIKVRYVTITDANCIAYLSSSNSDGPAISPSSPFGGGGAPWAFMKKEYNGDTYGYILGTVCPQTSDYRSLIIRCDVNNVSKSNQDFQPLDIGIDDEKAALGALGVGSIPFAKNKAGWDNFRKSKPQVIPNNESQRYIYVFTVLKDRSSWNLTYKGNKVCDLKK